MNILLIHQGLPAQFKHLIPALSLKGHKLWAISKKRKQNEIPGEINYYSYSIHRGNSDTTHSFCSEFESKTIRAEAVAKTALELKGKGFAPDLILGHPGWGEMLFLGDIWPNAPQMHYVEFFYGVEGTDDDFDGGLPIKRTWIQRATARMKNAHNLSNLNQMKLGITPTKFQHSLLPDWASSRTKVVHDGINTDWLMPNSRASINIPARENLPLGIKLNHGDPVVTFINRTFEPYRGIHIFMEAIAGLQLIHPTAHTILVGQDTAKTSYGAPRIDGIGWLSALKQKFGKKLNWSTIHPLGLVSHETLRKVYQVSAAHTYLSYPFVLSWSLLEAMSCGTNIIGSDTAPVREVITHGQNGLLVPFQDPNRLTKTLDYTLRNRHKLRPLRDNARKTILESYRLEDCVRKQIELVNTFS